MSDFQITNREALGQKIVEVCKDHAAGYRRGKSQFNTAGENEVLERCACAASNSAFFVLSALGYSTDDINRFAAMEAPSRTEAQK